MNPERLQLKGMLAESKKQLGELRTQASGYVLIIRSLLNPYEDVSKLDKFTDVIVEHSANI